MQHEILETLDKHGIEYTLNPNKPYEVTLRCFSGEHEDSNPSLSYNLEKGVFHCFSCGFGGNEVKFLKELGITAKTNPLTKQGFKLIRIKNKLDTVKQNRKIHLPEPIMNYVSSFRNISAETMIEFDAFTTTQDPFADYICIPIYQRSKLRFVEGRHRDVIPTKMPKYMRRPSGVDVSEILFPLDKIRNFSKVILVEGIMDVLRLWELGFDTALCIFGTQNFNPLKARLLDECGVREVIILMDGDRSGKKAAQNIKNLLEKRQITTYTIELPEDVDPGSFEPYEAEYYLGRYFS